MLVRYSPAESVMNSFLEDFLSSDTPQSELVPRCDVLERENDYAILMELPGVPKDDVKVEYQNHLLTVSGEKKMPAKKESERYFRVERRYGAFSRSFRVGTEIDTGKIQAAFDNGILAITLPKTEKAQPKKIEVSVG
ncbi:MAG: Hsp20/alpha crystallin family protein [Candidatus Zixiibacteriota bacterium]|nr:MAG: Hsp20/alpha crystallin family protein [candidate division Zixibacteria bacterium]